MRILLAEDDQNITAVCEILLSHVGGFEVISESDGQKALNRALNEPFDILLLDDMMPSLSGLEVAKQYLIQHQKPAPILFLSARTQDEQLDRFAKIGSGFLAKPFEPQQLLDLVKQITSGAK